MSVAIAVTVTFPNTTAALLVATGTDVQQTIGREVARLLTTDVVASKVDTSGATWSATVT